MRRIAALVAIVLLAVLASEGTALAGPSGPQRPPSGAVAAADQQQPSPIRLDLSTMNPRVVTAAGPPELVLTGSITNTGTAPVDSVGVRAQRGAPLASEGEMRSALEGEAAVDGATPPFTDLGTLAPGATVPFRYAVPLAGDPAQTLGLSEPGTYPLLVNVNGAAGGERSRLASARMLLPVTGLPGAPQAEPPVASPFSMLYPITEAPKRIPPVPGEPVLTDDDLATSFAPGGRLRGLVDALAQQAPTGSPVRAGVCLAVDPELVATAAAMRGGYQVAAPGGPLTPGRGAEAADQWLTALSATARGSCVLALPSSDADLVALVRGGQAELARAAVEQGREQLSRDLGVPVLSGTVWPSGGVLDEPTLDALPGATSLLLSSEGIGDTDTARTAGVVPVNGPRGPVRAVVTDPLLTQAAGGAPDLGTARPGPGDVVAGGSGPMSTQDLVGTLAYRASAGPGEGPMVVAPPHRWTADGAAASGLLSAVATLIADGRLAPTGLSAVTSTTPVSSDAAGGGRLYYPVQAGSAEIPASAVAVVADQVRGIAELQSAAEARTGVGASPEEVFGSLRLGMLRAVSGAWRGDPAAADSNAALVADRVARLRGTVRVLEPPSPYSLGTSDAPLLITVANGLPVTMNVRVVLSTSSGLRIAPIPEQTVPPLGRVQVRVSAKVTRAGQFSVDAGLRTPDGAMLGPDTRLRVRSTVYGTVTVWLTAVAGAVFLVLVVRRILRRIRPGGYPPASAGPPDPPDRGPPGHGGVDPNSSTVPTRVPGSEREPVGQNGPAATRPVPPRPAEAPAAPRPDGRTEPVRRPSSPSQAGEPGRPRERS